MQTSVRLGDRRNLRNVFGSAAYYLAFAVCLAVVLVVWYFAAHEINYVATFPYLEDVLAALFHALVDPYFWSNFLITLVRVSATCGRIQCAAGRGDYRTRHDAARITGSVFTPFPTDAGKESQ